MFCTGAPLAARFQASYHTHHNSLALSPLGIFLSNVSPTGYISPDMITFSLRNRGLEPVQMTIAHAAITILSKLKTIKGHFDPRSFRSDEVLRSGLYIKQPPCPFIPSSTLPRPSPAHLSACENEAAGKSTYGVAKTTRSPVVRVSRLESTDETHIRVKRMPMDIQPCSGQALVSADCHRQISPATAS